MKFIGISLLALASAVGAFAPTITLLHHRAAETTSLSATRQDFLSTAAAGLLAIATATTTTPNAVAWAMDQQEVTAPTEQWETGKPTPAAEADRVARASVRRTQLDSNFAPIKRLNLERKSPVTRLDINGPSFTAYHQTLPGLFRD